MTSLGPKKQPPLQTIQEIISFVRGHKVIFDSDLAMLYGVTTKRLNQQLNRNLRRFPDDFAFQLSQQEVASLRLQNATSNPRGGRRNLPFVFTEHGAVMAATILNSEQAVAMSIEVVRAFVKLRALIASNADLSKRLDAIERRYDGQFKVVFNSIRELIDARPKMVEARQKRTKQIGFGRDEE